IVAPPDDFICLSLWDWIRQLCQISKDHRPFTTDALSWYWSSRGVRRVTSDVRVQQASLVVDSVGIASHGVGVVSRCRIFQEIVPPGKSDCTIASKNNPIRCCVSKSGYR